MTSRKSITIPIVLTLIMIIIMVYFFANIRQTEVICSKYQVFSNDIHLNERIISKMDGKEITDITVKKEITLPEKYANDESINTIYQRLNKTLEYLGKQVEYAFDKNQITVTIETSKEEIILLDNISFPSSNNPEIKVNSNTKSNEVIPLKVGDAYTEGEFMKYMRSKGYNCK